MPLDNLPGTQLTPTRDDVRESYLRSYRIRQPDALTTEGTQPWIDGSLMADTAMPLYQNSIVAFNNGVPKFKTGAALDEWGEGLGYPRLAAVGGSGFVEISASVGGTTILAGDEIKDKATGLRFQCSATGLYTDGAPVPISGIDTGPATNLPAGITTSGGQFLPTTLTWTSPRPGCNADATVVQQLDGSGLSGGHDAEDDGTYFARLSSILANPPASGNDAEYQATIAKTPGVAAEQGFTYPAINGSGSMGIAFTIRPTSPGSGRIPNGTQIAAVLAYVQSQMPADDGIFAATLTGVSVDVVLKVSWTPTAPSWADTSPWPAYYSISGQAIVVQSATDATHFVLKSANSVYTAIAQPVPGQTLAFYDHNAQKFRRKRILTVTGTGPWTIVCDITNGVSDLSYTPAVSQRVGPWSDSLDDLALPVVSYFDTLGPGEQVSVFYGDGVRQKRSPPSPLSFPSVISNRLISPVLDVASVADAELIEPTVPLACPVGTPGVASNIFQLGNIAAFPE